MTGPGERSPSSGAAVSQRLLGAPRAGLIAMVRAYRLFLSPWLGNQCRFEPTCSRYAIEAMERHGAAAGSYLTTARLLRCHPWCQPGLDPVPTARPRLFAHLFTSATVAVPPADPSPEPAAPASSDLLSSSRLSS